VVEKIVAPRLDYDALTKAHIVLCDIEKELRAVDRDDEADSIAYVDLLVLAMRNRLEIRSGH
jgi:hypothetical protein